MQGVHEAVLLDRAAGGDQRLTGHLAAEDPLGTHLRALTLEGGRVDLLEVENVQELIDRGLSAQGLAHWAPLTVAGSTSEPSWCTRSVLVLPGAFGGLPATTTT
ncbi:hypothetical protein KRM28CT15_23230 [Krasilnikovia sp. M28-CT-15]